jgi:Arc/MetJ-type ribon-helix-helix transcriptional regulator
MIDGMAKVEKVTVSLPPALLDFVERERARTGASRSETVVAMLSEVRRRIELEAREARYAEAYARQPETEDERGFHDAAAAEAFADAGDEWSDIAPSSGDRRSRDRKVNVRRTTGQARSATRKVPAPVAKKAVKRAPR